MKRQPASSGGPGQRKRAREDGASPAPDPWEADHATYGHGEAVELTRLERLAADAVAHAHAAIPAVTHHDRADLTALERFRKALDAEAQRRQVKLTALPFLVKALAKALAACPRLNASLLPDGRRLWIRKYHDIAVAVDTPQGLTVPVVRGCARKGVWRIAAEIQDLAARAQQGRIKPAELGGAGMTITNLGGYGGTGFSPIVNPPQVAILGVARASIEPVWNGEAFAPVLMLPLSMTFDHRAIDGATAARFLRSYADMIAAPQQLLF